MKSIYELSPSVVFDQNGMYATSFEFTDLNNDGYLDLIAANGNDMSPQPLSVYYNNGRSHGLNYQYQPDWYSSDIGQLSRLVTGDINNDGYQDVIVVAAFTGTNDDISPGVVKVYLNDRGHLASQASFVLQTDHFPFAIDLADVDRDGYLDLGVVYGYPALSSDMNTAAVVYKNQQTSTNCFEVNDLLWKSATTYNGLSIAFYDVNLDGFIDLTIGHDAVVSEQKGDTTKYSISTFYGGEADVLATKPSQAYSFGGLSAFSLSMGVLKEGAHLREEDMIVLAGGIDFNGSDPSETFQDNFYLFSALSTNPIWATNIQEMNIQHPVSATISDVDNDGIADFLFSFMNHDSQQRSTGLPFYIFEGSIAPDRVDFQPAYPYGVVDEKYYSVIEQINLASIPNTSLEQHQFVAEKYQDGTVITLPFNTIQHIDSVLVDGDKVHSFQWSQTHNWLSIVTGKNTPEVVVYYAIPLAKDIVCATWNPNLGSSLYYSNYSDE